MEGPIAWFSEDVATDLALRDKDLPCKVMDLNQLVYELLKHGQPNDIVVLPFFNKFLDIAKHIRERGINGPIVIYSRGDAMIMNLLDLAAQGVVCLDSERFSKPMVLGFLHFLLRNQSLMALPDKAKDETKVYGSRPPQDEQGIKELFMNIMHRRVKPVLTCQFRPSLPTLTVTCEVIQMVGEVETKLVLDKFEPPEFVGLYKQMANNKPISGFVTVVNDDNEEQSMGFDFHVTSAVKGKMTVLLPPAVFEQKRKFFRVEPDKNEPVTMHLRSDAGTMTFGVADISEGGMGFDISYNGLEKGKSYPVAVELGGQRMIMGEAEIVFKGSPKNGLTTYGISTELNAPDLQQLRHYVYKRQAGILAALKDLKI